MMKALSALFIFFLAASTNAFSYSQQGHRAIAILASEFLSPEKKRHTQEILGQHDNLAEIATGVQAEL